MTRHSSILRNNNLNVNLSGSTDCEKRNALESAASFIASVGLGELVGYALVLHEKGRAIERRNE